MLNDKNITYAKLKDICQFARGETLPKIMDVGQIPIISSARIPLGYIDVANRSEPCITISSIGVGSAGKNILFHPYPIFAQNNCFSIVPKNKKLVLCKFLYYSLVNIHNLILSSIKGGAQKVLYPQDINNLSIIIPSLEIQNYIISILDQFNNLTSSLQDGIPAEIKLRKEQYQYYLKKLLSFNNQTK